MPTLQDIANIAGVSKATVSLALADHQRISTETKRKVRNIARKLGYIEGHDDKGQRDPLAKRVIGVVYISDNQDFEKGFFRETLMGISDEASRLKSDVVLIGIQLLDNESEMEDIANKVLESNAEGIIVISNTPLLKGLDKLIEMKFPILIIGERKVEGTVQPLPIIASDNYNGGKMATDYLLALGHTRIAAALRSNAPHWEMERLNGFCTALRNAGLTYTDDHVISVNSPFHPEDPCWERFAKLKPTAVFATNAKEGLTILNYLRWNRIRIPDEVSLIVFDDFASFPYESPPITVVKQDKETLGTLSVKMLLDTLNYSHHLPARVLISTQFIERQSCASPMKKEEENEG